MYNAVLERIHQVLGNMVRNFKISNQIYFDKDDPCTGILSAEAFEIRSTTNIQRGYSLGQLIFGRDITLPIKHTVDWELTRHLNQMKMKKYNIRKNRYIVNYSNKVRDDVMITNHTAYKY